VSNTIHSTVIIDGDVKLGNNNVILPYTLIYGPTEIGDNNIIGPNVVIGSPGQDTRNPRYDSKDCFIKIGNNNIIREFTAVQKPCYKDITEIKNNVFLMQSVHIPHDAIIEDDVVITPMCVLAGITRIMQGANLAMGSTIKQYCVIGQYSIVATGSAVLKNVKPFCKFIPGKPLKPNDYAIKKFGFEEFKDEIYKYVLEDIKPNNDKLLSVINEFEKQHLLSKQELY
jgi:UDP-N-acetylglucosamine acyltransferase